MVEEGENETAKVEEEEETEEAEAEIVEEEEEESMGEAAEEERFPPPEREKLEEIVEERIYTIPLGKAWASPRKRRSPRAIRLIKSFVQRHMKVGTKTEEEEEGEGRLIISNEVNQLVWRRGIEKPPRKIRVRAVKDKEGNVTVYLAEGD